MIVTMTAAVQEAPRLAVELANSSVTDAKIVITKKKRILKPMCLQSLLIAPIAA
jgi:hypothetical protein